MRGGIFVRALIVATLLLSSAPALAHDSRPAYLEIIATEGAVFELSWKRPLFGGRPPAMEMALPPACRDVVPPVSSDLGDALLERRLIDCGDAGLAGEQIRFPGLEETLSDVLVRIEQADGGTFTQRATAEELAKKIDAMGLPARVAYEAPARLDPLLRHAGVDLLESPYPGQRRWVWVVSERRPGKSSTVPSRL